MTTMIELTNGDSMDLKSAREALELKSEHLFDLFAKRQSTTLDLGRYLIDVRESELASATLTNAERKSGDVDGFAKWYTTAKRPDGRVGYDRAEVSRWIRFAETFDRANDNDVDLAGESQSAVLALATANDEDLAEIVERAETMTGAGIRETRKAIDAERNPDPGPPANDDDEDDEEPTHNDLAVATIVSGPATFNTTTTNDLRVAASVLLAEIAERENDEDEDEDEA